ncbi:hypothetical protein NS2R_04830 [Pseudomonas oryzihabitans]|nr:hypothetical protein NS2R_04830 [Pseudomonas psychrotolerans]
MENKNSSNRNEADALSELLQEPHQNRRHDIWLWLYLYYQRRLNLDLRTCNGITMRDELAKNLEKRKYLLSRIPQEKDRYLLPNETLNWIENNERQLLWLTRQIQYISDMRLPIGLIHLTGRDRLIGLIDIWDIEISEKERGIENLHWDWKRHTAKDIDFVWFADKKESEKRCLCAWEWLKKNHFSMQRFQVPISNYPELLIFFDGANLSPYEQTAMIRDIKKRWSRKQFDERAADKKQINFMLSKTVIAQLDALSQKHDLKRAQIVEMLVAMEIEAGVYLDKG